jgi:hypothetical protein
MMSRPPGCGVPPGAAATLLPLACGVEVAGAFGFAVAAAADDAPVVFAPVVVAAAGAAVGVLTSGLPPQAARIAAVAAATDPPTNTRRFNRTRSDRSDICVYFITFSSNIEH